MLPALRSGCFAGIISEEVEFKGMSQKGGLSWNF